MSRPTRRPSLPRAAAYEAMEALTDAQVRDLHAMYGREWWSGDRTLADVRAMLRHTDVVVAFAEPETGRLVAFARVLTDYVYKALINDVMVEPDLRGGGLGRALMEAVLRHPELASVRHFELYCLPEMAPFYEEWGFTDGLDGLLFMRRVTPEAR